MMKRTRVLIEAAYEEGWREGYDDAVREGYIMARTSESITDYESAATQRDLMRWLGQVKSSAWGSRVLLRVRRGL